ncbi:MAG: hypothetical protein K8I27_01860 [Planctomycetes bacterium]|nr:hypothetical protein [Planctomycetota bacterium]
MAGNSPIRYAKIERALNRGGALELNINGSHHNWAYRVIVFAIPVHRNLVKARYVKLLRRAWKLTPADGVSDKDFLERRLGRAAAGFLRRNGLRPAREGSPDEAKQSESEPEESSESQSP